MKRVLAALSLALVSSPAFAGVGSSYGLGTFSAFAATNGWQLPSVDVRNDRFHLQIKALDTLAYLANEDIFLSGSVWIPYMAQDLGKGAVVVQPGGSAVLTNIGDSIGLTGGARMGAEWADQGGLGVYVVPQLGVGYDGDVEVLFSGFLEISVWLDA